MKTVSVFLVLVLFAVAAAEALRTESEYSSLFGEFIRQHRPHGYGSVAEQQYRYSVFKKNLDYIDEYNAKNNGVTLGMNQFGDMTNEEFRAQIVGGFKPRNHPAVAVHKSNTRDPLPEQVDWRQKNAVTKVKDQGYCGSCWAFSATGAMEGAWAIAKGQLIPLSEQQLMDCSWKYGNEGCDGGDMKAAFQYVIDNKGIDSEQCYGYKTRSSKKCLYDPKCAVANFSSYVNITQYSEDDLANAVAFRGPVSVAIDASHSSFQFYVSGVYVEPECSHYEKDLDHGVLVVGYNFSNKKLPYWIVKNSWGTDWGQSGYIWMAKGNNMCGIATYASYPVVD